MYYSWKNIRKQYKSNKLKIIAPTWNDEFESPDFSDIQDYIEYIDKNHKTLTTIPPVHVYINRINNRLVLKMKYGYKLELQIIWLHRKINRQNKKWRKSTKS